MTTSPKITLWGVEVFVAAAEEASISGAARRLGSSAATVSQQISNLESALGVRLMHRAARPVTLTPEGDMFLRRANTILNEAEQARAELARADLSRLTRLRIGMVEDFDAEVTPGLLQGLSRSLHNCRFLLETGASHRLAEMLDARALDVIVAADIGQDAGGLQSFPLLEEPFVVAAPKGLINHENIADQLADMPLIQYTRRHYMGRAIAAHLARQNITPSSRFELDSYHAILAMVAAGAGWSILTPLGYLRARRFDAAIDLFPLPYAPLSRRISLMARRDVLGEIPATMAAEIRPLVSELIVAPAVTAFPWLAGQLRVLAG